MMKKRRTRDWHQILPEGAAYAQQEYELRSLMWRAHKQGLSNRQIAEFLGESLSSVAAKMNAMRRSNGPSEPPITEWLENEYELHALGDRCREYEEIRKKFNKRDLAAIMLALRAPSARAAIL